MKFEIVPMQLFYANQIYDILQKNQTWRYLNMKRMPTQEEHEIYWDNYHSFLHKKEFVAVSNNNVLGVVGFSKIRGFSCMKIWVYTHSDYRNQGIAKSLISFVESLVQENGQTLIITTINSKNTASKKLFRSCDYFLSRTWIIYCRKYLGFGNSLVAMKYIAKSGSIFSFVFLKIISVLFFSKTNYG